MLISSLRYSINNALATHGWTPYDNTTVRLLYPLELKLVTYSMHLGPVPSECYIIGPTFGTIHLRRLVEKLFPKLLISAIQDGALTSTVLLTIHRNAHRHRVTYNTYNLSFHTSRSINIFPIKYSTTMHICITSYEKHQHMSLSCTTD